MLKVTVKDSGFLKREIVRSGKSIRSFSEEIEISNSYLSQVINGSRNPSGKVAYKIANGLDKSFDEIFLILNGRKSLPIKQEDTS